MGEAMGRSAISDAVEGLGWRLVLDVLCGWVPAASLGEAAGLAAHAVKVAGAEADVLLSIDVRRDRLVMSVRSPPDAAGRAVALARRLAAELPELGPPGHGGSTGTATAGRSVQMLEVAIDALDIPAVRPFWKAVLGYVDRPGESPVTGAIADPWEQGPRVWFQQMDAPRRQRNRVHVDVTVPHDAAERRLAAALDAGGTVVSDAAAPAFWVLADAEGNEACISTWQGRD